MNVCGIVFCVVLFIAGTFGVSPEPCVNGLCREGFTCQPGDICVSNDTPRCVDKLNAQGINECPGKVNLCNNTLYYTLMTQQCPKTCNFCGTPGTCVDKLNAQGINECPSRISLCNNAAYRDLMTQQCPKTCNRCPSINA
uniref:ShKT domain-containing protein n=1 Tax=Panagrolaimus davidi TaxID=227884 RepID=A0A914PL57_9BILA